MVQGEFPAVPPLGTPPYYTATANCPLHDQSLSHVKTFVLSVDIFILF